MHETRESASFVAAGENRSSSRAACTFIDDEDEWKVENSHETIRGSRRSYKDVYERSRVHPEMVADGFSAREMYAGA